MKHGSNLKKKHTKLNDDLIFHKTLLNNAIISEQFTTHQKNFIT